MRNSIGQPFLTCLISNQTFQSETTSVLENQASHKAGDPCLEFPVAFVKLTNPPMQLL